MTFEHAIMRILLIDGYNVRTIHAATGEIIRRLTIDPEWASPRWADGGYDA